MQRLQFLKCLAAENVLTKFNIHLNKLLFDECY
jgi:hypothetical protein